MSNQERKRPVVMRRWTAPRPVTFASDGAVAGASAPAPAPAAHRPPKRRKKTVPSKRRRSVAAPPSPAYSPTSPVLFSTLDEPEKPYSPASDVFDVFGSDDDAGGDVEADDAFSVDPDAETQGGVVADIGTDDTDGTDDVQVNGGVLYTRNDSAVVEICVSAFGPVSALASARDVLDKLIAAQNARVALPPCEAISDDYVRDNFVSTPAFANASPAPPPAPPRRPRSTFRTASVVNVDGEPAIIVTVMSEPERLKVFYLNTHSYITIDPSSIEVTRLLRNAVLPAIAADVMGPGRPALTVKHLRDVNDGEEFYMCVSRRVHKYRLQPLPTEERAVIVDNPDGVALSTQQFAQWGSRYVLVFDL